MIVTTQTPKYEGSTVEEGGCLLDMADVLDVYGTGVKVNADRDEVDLTANSTGYPQTRLHLDADTAEHLGQLLIAAAKQARDY